jgi:hypothetical protein
MRKPLSDEERRALDPKRPRSPWPRQPMTPEENGLPPDLRLDAAKPPRYYKFGPAAKDKVVEFVAQHGWNLGAMATVVDINVNTLRRHLNADADFRDRCERARLTFGSWLEAVAVERATRGWKEPRWAPDGTRVDVSRFSDALLIRELKANLPEKFADKLQVEKREVSVSVDLSAMPPEFQDRVLALMEDMRAAGVLQLPDAEDATPAQDAEFDVLPGADPDLPDEDPAEDGA